MIGLIYGVCLFLLIIGTFTDIRVREVPDWINYSGIFAGLGIRLIYSLYSFDWSFILEGLLGFIVFFAIGVAMFYSGQWGGGDSKLLMALGALLGLQLNLSNFTIGFIINLMIVGGIYGFIWTSVLAIKNWDKFLKEFKKRLSGQGMHRLLFFGAAAVLFIIAMLMQDVFMKFLLFFIALFIPVMNYMILFVKAVEKSSMLKRVRPNELTEGDWIAKDVFVKKRRICGPKDLGIEKYQIKKLIKLKVKSVIIKAGIPFVPSFLLAFLLTLWIGNPLAVLI